MPATDQNGPLLRDQICFRLYAASRLVTRLYQPVLAPLGLTYPQYIILMILWEFSPCRIGVLGEQARLNSNTLAPLLKRLQEQGMIERQRDPSDERAVRIALTAQGWALRETCRVIPARLLAELGLDAPGLASLRDELDQLLQVLDHSAGTDALASDTVELGGGGMLA